MQAVGKLDQHDADVVDHGQHHLAEVLGLLFLTRGEINLADLGDALDDVGNLLAKLFSNVDDRDRSVLDGVVQ